MAVARKPDAPVKMTVDAFLEWQEDKEGKWELHDGVPVRKHDPARGDAERIRHVNTKAAVYVALLNALEKAGSDCHAVTDGATVHIDKNISYVPDALVYCGKAANEDAISITDPLVIVEVLSPSTAYKDVSTKLEDYFKLPSVLHYVILDPKLKRIQHHYRDGERVRLDPVEGEILKLDPPGLTLAVRELFA